MALQSRETQRLEPLSSGRTADGEPQAWTAGYSAFWRDLAAAWLVALLLAGAVLAAQSANTPRPGLAIGASIAEAPRRDDVARVRRAGDDDPECSDLDFAYLRC